MATIQTNYGPPAPYASGDRTFPHDNEHNKWLINSTLKTCKCHICKERVKTYSWVCDQCSHHICEECAQPNGTSREVHKIQAANNLLKKCNCYYSSGLAPELRHLIMPHPMDAMMAMPGYFQMKANYDARVQKAKIEQNPITARLKELQAEGYFDKEPSDYEADDEEDDNETVVDSQSPTLSEQDRTQAAQILQSMRYADVAQPGGGTLALSETSVPNDSDAENIPPVQPPARGTKRNASPEMQGRVTRFKRSIINPETINPEDRSLIVVLPIPAHVGGRKRKASDEEEQGRETGPKRTKANAEGQKSLVCVLPISVAYSTEPTSPPNGSPTHQNDEIGLPSPGTSPRPPPPIEHLSGGHTVIAGARIVGLFVARELAIRMKETQTPHTIAVIEPRETYCKCASGHCAGNLDGRFLPESLQELAGMAQEAWREMWNKEKAFSERIDYRWNSILMKDTNDVGSSSEESSEQEDSRDDRQDWNGHHQNDDGHNHNDAGNKEPGNLSEGHRASKNAQQMNDTQGSSQSVEWEEKPAHMPNWFHGLDYTLKSDKGSYGQCNTSELADWVHEQCALHGVIFRFNSALCGTLSNVNSDISCVDIQNIHSNTLERLPCTNLILACGPFTTGLYSDLFYNRSRNLSHNVQKAVWLKTGPHPMSRCDRAVLLVPNAAANIPSLLPSVTLIGDPHARTVQLSAVRARVYNANVDCLRVLEMNKGAPQTAGLLTLVEPLLGVPIEPTSQDKGKGRAAGSPPSRDTAVVEQGMELLCTTGRDSRPVIGKVPASILRAKREDNERVNGVWLCYGFGNHGTFLAPGAGKLLGRMICGEDGGAGYDGPYALHKDLEVYVKPKKTAVAA